MDDQVTKRLASVLAIQAEIEGMKAENLIREQEGHALSYTEKDFQDKADQLKYLARVRLSSF